MPIRVTICTVIIGLICPFTQVARGQQSDPVQPPPAAMIEGPQYSVSISVLNPGLDCNHPT